MLNQKYSTIYSSIAGELLEILGNCNRGDFQVQTSKGWNGCPMSSEVRILFLNLFVQQLTKFLFGLISAKLFSSKCNNYDI